MTAITLQSTSRPNAEIPVNSQRRVRLVERIEVDAVDLMIEEVSALLGGPVNADLGDRLVVTIRGSSKRSL